MAFDTELTSRTLTFLFTDLEGSTQLWEQFPQAMKRALERHDALLRAAVEDSHGQVVKTTGDGMLAVFSSALQGVIASLKAQHNLGDEPWEETGPLRVRMGLHVGEAQWRNGDFYGPAVNRAARLMSAAHGGQVLLSQAATNLVIDLLPPGITLRELGEHRLKDLARPERVFQLVDPELKIDFPPLASLDRRPNNLPAQPGALVGREAELIEIVSRFTSDGVRLLTLTGPGGIGKTRLALQAGAELIDHFEDGVFFVDLAPIRDPESVLTVISRTLGLRETSDRQLLDELVQQSRSKKMLLILDNFEQVIPAASHAVSLLQGCPQLKLLVTSREALHVRGEYIYPVPPLGLPQIDLKQPLIEQITQYEAVKLFIERAQAVKPGFTVTNENAPAIAEICIRLDGLPLAIELAAARIRLFSPHALLERLGTGLKFLQGGARDLPRRQQTLRDAIQWSYELLDSSEQLFFELLSVFSGGATVEAIEAVASEVQSLEESGMDSLTGLTSLLDKSLVRQVSLEENEPRMLMLETIREYAGERLEQDPVYQADVRRAHAEYFADFTKRQWQRLIGDERETALAELIPEIENIRSAWSYWVNAKDLEQINKFVDSLWLLYDARGWYHATVNLTNDLLNVLASTPPTQERLQEQVLLQTSLARALLAIKGYTPEVEAAYTRAMDLAQSLGEIPQLFPVLRGLSILYTYLGDFQKGAQMGEKILELAQRQDDLNMQLEGHMVLGYNLAFTGHIDQGLAHLEKAIQLFDPNRPHSNRFRLGNDPGVASLTISALILWVIGFPERSEKRMKEAILMARRVNHPFSTAYTFFHNSFLSLWRRDAEGAYDSAQVALKIAEEYDFQVWSAVATTVKGAALAEMGQVEEGLALTQKGNDLYRGLKTPPIFWSLLVYLQAGVYLRMGQPEQSLALIDDMIATNLSEDYVSNLMPPLFLRFRGDILLAMTPPKVDEAEMMYQQALKISQSSEANMFSLHAAIGLGRLWRDQGKIEESRQLLRSICEQFTEGHSSPELMEAQELM